tara:strand:+ start:769 stop:1353 length:585 start_codon:yes stop_codon:yes gene_type:complete
MGKLQLAENGTPAKMENYIFVPAGFMGATEDRYVREDVLDELPDEQYYEIVEALEMVTPNEMLGDRASRQARRQARREARQTRRAERRANRQRRKDYRMTKGERRREARERRLNIRQAGRTERAFGRQKAYGGAISGLVQKAGAGLMQPQVDQRGFPIGGELNFGTSTWEQYKWPIIIGGTVLMGGIAYILTRR